MLGIFFGVKLKAVHIFKNIYKMISKKKKSKVVIAHLPKQQLVFSSIYMTKQQLFPVLLSSIYIWTKKNYKHNLPWIKSYFVGEIGYYKTIVASNGFL
jgi:hypothetical protein